MNRRELITGAAGVCLAPTQQALSAEASSMRLLVPAYFDPGTSRAKYWDQLLSSAKVCSITAIVNPASGPGRRIDPAYTDTLRRCKEAGVRPIGYVSTSYAKRTLAEVQADIDTWLRFYPGIRGFFFDEQSSGPEKIDFYRALREYSRKQLPNAFVVTNPGIVPDRQYLDGKASDVVCVFEHHSGFEKWVRPEPSVPAERLYVLNYQVPDAPTMREHVARLTKERVGYYFCTEDKLPNPWDSLPPYWDELVAAVKAGRIR
jgi:hypothetical protein